MPDGDVWGELRASLVSLEEAQARLAARLELRDRDRRRLRCAECGRADPGDERGWTLRLDEDDELQAFCPDCDEREFG